MTDQSEYLKNDKLITSHYGEEFEHYYNAVVPPIFMNSLNVFETVDDYYDSDKTDKHVYCYGRVQNPTVRILEDKAAALEQGTGALAFASGMAAATTAVLTVCKAKSHVVCIRSAYGPLKTFLNEYCREHLDMSVTYVKGYDTEEFEHAVTDQTDLIILESPSSVVLSLQDIHAVSEIAKKHHAYVYIDNSFCTPIYQKPLLLGADIVMHTASKYMGGSQRYYRRSPGCEGRGTHGEAEAAERAFWRDHRSDGSMVNHSRPADDGGARGTASGNSHGNRGVFRESSKGEKGLLSGAFVSSAA